MAVREPRAYQRAFQKTGGVLPRRSYSEPSDYFFASAPDPGIMPSCVIIFTSSI